jgi:8-oxo-dGTP diphosphatase
MGMDAARVFRQNAAEDDGIVRAAGGVVLRRGESGVWEVAVVHRPRREDWSLPKGKLDPDESPEAGALREVEEETGLRCRLVRFAGYTEYVDRRGRPKIVAYWVMEVIDEGIFSAHAEVDELRWIEIPQALEVLTYGRDQDLVASVNEVASARSA